MKEMELGDGGDAAVLLCELVSFDIRSDRPVDCNCSAIQRIMLNNCHLRFLLSHIFLHSLFSLDFLVYGVRFSGTFLHCTADKTLLTLGNLTPLIYRLLKPCFS